MDGQGVLEVERLVREASPLVEVNGQKYSLKPLTRIADEREIATIGLETLTGFIDYIKAGPDTINKSKSLIVIDSHISVRLVTMLSAETKKRDRLVLAKLADNEYAQFPFERYMEHEEFIIKLLSLFVSTSDLPGLVEFVSKLTLNNSIKVEDNGVTQLVAVQHGMSGALKENAKAPSYVTLNPWRTFREIEQPPSKFLFRMRAQQSIPTCALYQADGGAWETEAKARIKKYLTAADLGITIIA